MLTPLLWITLVCAVLLAFASVRRIPEGQVYSLRRLGGHTRFLGAGTHMVMPLLERVAHKINLNGDALALHGQLRNGDAYTGALYFQILDATRADDVIDSIESRLHTKVAALLDLEQAPSDLSERRNWLKQSLNAKMRERGVLVTRVDLQLAK